MEGPAGFAIVLGEGATIFEPNGADGEVDADAEASCELEFIIKCPGVDEHHSFDRALDRAGVFHIGDPPGSAAEGIAFEIGTHFAFREGADGIGPAEELAEVDGEVLAAPGGKDESSPETEGAGAVITKRLVVAELGLGFEEADTAATGSEAKGGVKLGEPTIGREGGIITAVVLLAEVEAVDEILVGAD